MCPNFCCRRGLKGMRGTRSRISIDVPGVPSRRRSPKATGFADELLALCGPGLSNEDRQYIETNTMQEIDSSASIERLEMLHWGASKITEHQRYDWGRFLNSLRLRQPQSVEQKIRAESAAVLVRELERAPEEYQRLAQTWDPRTLVEWVQINEPGELHDFGAKIIPAVLGHDETLDRLRSLTWAVIDLSKASHELLLSDNPLISVGSQASPIWTLALPLSPTHLFFCVSSSGDHRTLQSNGTRPKSKPDK